MSLHATRIPIVLLFLLMLPAVAPALLAQDFECTGVDGWMPAGAGLDANINGVSHAASDGTLLYLFSTLDDTRSLSTWNGSVVTTLFTGPSSFFPDAMHAFDGKLYIAGVFDDVAGAPNTADLARWNGTSWESAGVVRADFFTGGRPAMTVHDNELYLFNRSGLATTGGTSLGNLARFDGTSWSTTGSPFGYVTAMASYGGDLIVSGSDATGATLYMRFDGTNWSPIPALAGQGMAGDMVEFQNALYFIPEAFPAVIWKWDGASTVTPVSDPALIPAVSYLPEVLTVFDNRLYTTGGVTLATDPPTSRLVAAYDGTNWQTVSSAGKPDTNWMQVIEHDGLLMAFGRFTSSCGVLLNNLAIHDDDFVSSRITGTVYRDVDGDCQFGAGDVGIPHRVVEIAPGPLYAATSSTGLYIHYVPVGTYTVTSAPILHWNHACPGGLPLAVTIATPGQVSAGNDIAEMPIPNMYDLRVSLAGQRIRPGFDTYYRIHYRNVGTEPVAGTLRFTYQSAILTLVSSTLPIGGSTSNTLQWNLPVLQPLEEGFIDLVMNADAGAPLGTTVCAEAELDLPSATPDVLPPDNHDDDCSIVTGAYDPNDITVTPAGDSTGHLRVRDTVLDYRVRFQNTGTDTAFRVVIRDTLDPSLDLPTISMGAASHPYTWHLEGSGVLVITFDDILLPDSNASEPESHGVVKYSLHLKRGLPPSTAVHNRVGIYFDFNSVVMTNQVTSLLPGVSGVDAASVPLPAVRVHLDARNELLRIDGHVAGGSTIGLRRIDGSIALGVTATGTGRETISTAGLASGFYLLELRTRQGCMIEKIVIAR